MRITPPKTIDEYIAGCSPAQQKRLAQMRAVIKQAAPAAVEKIKYGIPTFVLRESLVHFAGFKKHTGFYPTASGIKAFCPRAHPLQVRPGLDPVSARAADSL